MTQNAEHWSGSKRRWLIGIALVLATAYIFAAIFTDLPRLRESLRHLGWAGCAAVLALSGVNYLLRYFRWQHFLADLGRTLPHGRHLLVYLSGFAFTVSPAKAGEAVRSLYLRSHGVTYTESIATFFVERLLDLFAIVILASLIVAGHADFRPLIVATVILLATALVVISQAWLPVWIGRMTGTWSGRAGGAAAALTNLLRASHTLLRPRMLFFGILTGLVAWGAEGFGFHIICDSLHIHGPATTFVGIYAVAALAGSAAFMLPAGIGGMEIVMTTLLVQQGANVQEAIIATLLCRIATLWFAVIVGIGAAAAVELMERRLPGRSTA